MVAVAVMGGDFFAVEAVVVELVDALVREFLVVAEEGPNEQFVAAVAVDVPGLDRAAFGPLGIKQAIPERHAIPALERAPAGWGGVVAGNPGSSRAKTLRWKCLPGGSC